jgi:signal transduction histidine kinase/CheY-like chemotaxis protein
MKVAMSVLRPLHARLSFVLALSAAAAHAGGGPPETPVHAQLVRIYELFQTDRQAAITQLQALHDHMPAGATLDDRSKTINTLVNFYIETRDERARRYVDELAAFGAREHDLQSELWAENYRGRVLSLFDSRHAECVRVVEAALARDDGTVHRTSAAMHDTAAMCYQQQGDIKSALGHQTAALGLLDGRSPRDVFHRAIAMNNISILYSLMGDHRQALDYNLQAQAIAAAQHAQAMQGTLASVRCDLYGRLGEPDKAERACQQALSLARLVGDKELEASMQRRRSFDAWKAGRYADCLKLADTALALLPPGRTSRDSASLRVGMGLCHIGLGAVRQGESEVQAGLAFYRAGKEDDTVIKTLDDLATAYARAGLFHEAYGALRELGKLKEDAARHALDRATLKMRSEFEFTARQKEIAALREKTQLQQAELKNERLELALGVLAALLVGVIGFFKFRDKERSRRRALHENHKKSQFVAEAAHDLRQPMQAIGNLLGAASHALDRGDVAKGRELIDTTQKATNAMRSSFNAVLELSRLECGAIVAEYRSFDLGELVSETVLALRPLSEPRNVTIRVRLPCGGGPYVRSDRQMLGRVLANLLSNAIKYSDPSRPGGGAVVVGVVRLGCHCRVDIVDNGVGIPDALQKQVFKPFFQVDNPNRDRNRGIGLGLSIVASSLALLERHSLKLRSQAGVGSRFSVTVPCATAVDVPAPVAAPAPVTAADDVAGLYVLYVEDDGLVRQSTELLLREYRVLYESVGSLAELEALLPGLERMPDLVLTDYSLPNGRTARDVVRMVTGEFDTALPVIVLTGESARVTLADELEHATLLRKPVASATLLATIRAVCDSTALAVPPTGT